jgi:hypothetical protein
MTRTPTSKAETTFAPDSPSGIAHPPRTAMQELIATAYRIVRCAGYSQEGAEAVLESAAWSLRHRAADGGGGVEFLQAVARSMPDGDNNIALTPADDAAPRYGSATDNTNRLDEHSLMDVLRRLPTAERMCTALYFAGDFSYGEMADILGLPREETRARLHSGRARLRAALRTIA